MAEPRPDRCSEIQTERNVRGYDFEVEIRRSWRLVPNVWRRKVTDGKGATRPADEIVLTLYGNILAEHKRTAKDGFFLSLLRSNQLNGLRDFDRVIPQNYGLVFVNFNDPTQELNIACAFRLITAARYMAKKDRAGIPLKDLQAGVIPVIWLPYQEVPEIENKKPVLKSGWDLQEVPEKCRLL